jgi:ERCC4-related helicase
MNEKTGWPTSPGHDDVAFQLVMDNMQVRAFCVQNNANPDIVALICKNHMRFHQIGQMRPVKRDRQIQEWTDQQIWDDLQIFGAADNMLVEFDINDLQKSFKSFKG